MENKSQDMQWRAGTGIWDPGSLQLGVLRKSGSVRRWWATGGLCCVWILYCLFRFSPDYGISCYIVPPKEGKGKTPQLATGNETSLFIFTNQRSARTCLLAMQNRIDQHCTKRIKSCWCGRHVHLQHHETKIFCSYSKFWFYVRIKPKGG